MNKLCYIVPEYNSQSPTHFAYLVDFIEELKRSFDLYLIVEKEGRLKMIFKIFNARLRGYKDFYIHYSFFGAFVASLIVKIIGGRTFYWNCGLPWQYKRGFLRESFERFTYKAISFLVTGTEGLRRQYADHYNLPLEKIKVMPNWLKASNFQFSISNFQKNELKKKLNIASGQRIVLFVHRLSKRKGAHYLPEIMKRLADAKNANLYANDTNNFVLLVIGDGPEREEIELKAKSYNLKANFRFLGWVPNDELNDYYRIADIFIMPSEEEGFPHVLLEAMAAGVPFVAFDVGGIKEIVSPDLREYAVPVGDIDAFVIKIQKILNSKDVAAKISESETRRAAEFDIKRVVEIFKGLINKRESHSANRKEKNKISKARSANRES